MKALTKMSLVLWNVYTNYKNTQKSLKQVTKHIWYNVIVDKSKNRNANMYLVTVWDEWDAVQGRFSVSHWGLLWTGRMPLEGERAICKQRSDSVMFVLDTTGSWQAWNQRETATNELSCFDLDLWMAFGVFLDLSSFSACVHFWLQSNIIMCRDMTILHVQVKLKVQSVNQINSRIL